MNNTSFLLQMASLALIIVCAWSPYIMPPELAVQVLTIALLLYEGSGLCKGDHE